jgi:hypothetical protein
VGAIAVVALMPGVDDPNRRNIDGHWPGPQPELGDHRLADPLGNRDDQVGLPNYVERRGAGRCRRDDAPFDTDPGQLVVETVV